MADEETKEDEQPVPLKDRSPPHEDFEDSPGYWDFVYNPLLGSR